MNHRSRVVILILAAQNRFVFTTNHGCQVDGFAPTCLPHSTMRTIDTRTSPLWYVNTELPNVSEMKPSEMKKELESYGISTESLFDKAEYEMALQQARLKQKTEVVESLKERIKLGDGPGISERKEKNTVWEKQRTEGNEGSDNGSATAQDASRRDTRQDRYNFALQEGIAMKLSDLKKELKDRGISTSSFFEKLEMAKAYAEAIADNVFKKTKSSVAATDSSDTQRTNTQDVFDPSYRDVNVIPFNARMTILPSDIVIDVL